MKEIQLRDYQDSLITGIRSTYASKRKSPLLVLPTGGGKTFIFSYIAGSAAAKGKRCVILVHRQELLNQSSESLTKLGVDHGLIAPGRPVEFGKAVQVASVQTLTRRFGHFDKAGWLPDLIIIDEAHHATAGSWRKVVEKWEKSAILGVTATPCRLDGKGLGIEAGGVFDVMVDGPQICELIERGFLSPPEVYAPPIKADLKGIRTRMGDFAKNEVNERMDKPTVTGDAVNHYAKICPGVPAIAFCVSVAHAEHVAAQFNASGWKAASLDGSMSDADRKARINDLAEGRLHVLTSCDIISEGTDIPVVGAAILLRPTKSLSLYLQQVGRALRVCEGKDRAYILDHVGNVQTHGMPDDPRDWSLDGEKSKKRAANDNGPPPPITCEKCFQQIRRPAPPVCPGCGAALKPNADRMDKLEHTSGELKKVTAEDRAAMQRERKREQAQAKTLQELTRLGYQRGYKSPEKWAFKVHSSRSARYAR